MFLREKKVKDMSYLYVVENVWNKGKVKQKVKKYLGRIYNFNVTKSVSFESFVEKIKKENFNDYILKNNEDSIIYDLLAWELYKRGFKIDNKNARKGELVADFNKKRGILNLNGRPFCIKTKEGYINNWSINLILNIKNKTDEDIDKKKVAFDFARMFVEGGIKIPKEVFIELFHRKFMDESLKDKDIVSNASDEENYIRY